jgi:hypothetical protein|tara:strand:+ start:4697 stop:5161 length:465 start_codon:yes stop_codon:yes gene_type:complete
MRVAVTSTRTSTRRSRARETRRWRRCGARNSSSIRRHRLTDDAQAARALERARDSVGDTTAMRTDDADAAIERAKRAMVLGRRVSEKTRKKRREEEEDDDATTTRATTARLALVRDRATLLVVDARERVEARARAVEVDVRVDDVDDERSEGVE